MPRPASGSDLSLNSASCSFSAGFVKLRIASMSSDIASPGDRAF